MKHPYAGFEAWESNIELLQHEKSSDTLLKSFNGQNSKRLHK